VVDAVEPQAAGIAPGPHRVRVHAKESRRFGDGQRRVDRGEAAAVCSIRLYEEL
jgi:hypothetical protein